MVPQYTTEGERGTHSRAVGTTVHYRGRERFTFEDCEYYSTLQREKKVHTRRLLVPQYTTEGDKGSHSRTVSTTVHCRGRERFTLKDCEYYSTLQRERKVHTQGLLVPQYTTEGEKGSHLRTVSTTVHYREKGSHSRNVSTTLNYTGRERFTLKGCWYHGTLQRERKVHTQVL